MADQEHVEQIQQGVDGWNQWRKEHPDIQPDLSRADLSGADLSGAILRRTILSGANLIRVDLSGAILSEANLSNASLTEADLCGATLWKADLSEADLSGADLSRASLTEANLSRADLSGANLSRADLSGANLSRISLIEANLTEANLSRTDLSEADLSRASLTEADLSKADLSGANLSRASLTEVNLTETNLSRTDLSNANLSGVDLSNANLSGVDLSNANLSRARLQSTIFARVNLLTAKGLGTVVHRGPSIVDVKTVVLPQGNILNSFLRGTGFPDTFIDYLPSLLNTPIHYQSCFISYTGKDDRFASKLYASLQESGVRCWFAPEDLKIGDHYHQRIDESIRLYDKLVLILSKHAVQSAWVEREVVAAREKEDRERRLVLFPLRLDDAVMDTTIAWAADVRRRWHIGDFTQWKHHDAYQQGFERLLRDLKADRKPKA